MARSSFATSRVVAASSYAPDTPTSRGAVGTPLAGSTRKIAMSAAPETVSGPRRLAALGAVALAAFGIALAARETGAVAPLEREALKARFDVRGAEPVDGLLVVGIDAKTFAQLQERWPFPRGLHGRVVRKLHAAGAREIVYDVQFTEPTVPRQDFALFDAIDG